MAGVMGFFFKQKTAYEIYQCDWSSDVCSSDLGSLVDIFSGFFGGNKLTLTPSNPADRQKQQKVAAVWKQRLNSMGYPITLAQSRAILGTHWGGNFNEQLAQYKKFVAKLPLHAIPHPYGTSWNSFIALFPGYNPKAIAKLSSTYQPPIKYPKPYDFTPKGGTYNYKPKGGTYQGSTQEIGRAHV